MKETDESEPLGMVILYSGKRVKVVEKATGFVREPNKSYWVRALEPVAGYAAGEEFTVSAKYVKRQWRKEQV